MSDFNDEDLAAWCDEHLPDLYDEGMFDHEDAAEEVWEGVEAVIEETLIGNEDDEELAEQLHAAATAWFAEHHDLRIAALTPVDATTLESFRTKPQTDQHSAEWYAQRRNRLTASEFAQILDGRRAALLRSKLYPIPSDATPIYTNKTVVAIAQPDGEMNATSWGHRFEPVTRRIYELEIAGLDTVCDTLGRFTHPTVPWLSASPDGLVMRGPLAGRLVEIKSPKTRQPGHFVPDDYYVQMQLQMEVCDLEAVDFIEAQFAQRTVQLFGFETPVNPDPILTDADADATALEAAPWKGRVQVWGNLEDPSTWVYRYTDPVEDLDDAAFTTPEPTGLDLLESSVWWLTGWYPRTVLRSPTWWNAVGWPNAELFWAEVESLRSAQLESRMEEDAPVDEIQHVGGWLGSL
jgi:putative phage-type endonuclease